MYRQCYAQHVAKYLLSSQGSVLFNQGLNVWMIPNQFQEQLGSDIQTSSQHMQQPVHEPVSQAVILFNITQQCFGPNSQDLTGFSAYGIQGELFILKHC